MPEGDSLTYMFSSDYPHSATLWSNSTLWPNSQKHIAAVTKRFSDVDREQLLGENAATVYGFDLK